MRCCKKRKKPILIPFRCSGLRFNLKNMDTPKDEEIKAIKGVMGVARTGGQYQIIIGTNVDKV